MGVSAEISVWTERWTVQRVEKHDERVVVDTIEVQRRTEKRELAHEASGVAES